MPTLNRARVIAFATTLVAVLGLFAHESFAKPTGKDDAVAAVGAWLKQPGRGLGANVGNEVSRTEVYTDAAGAPAYYVVYLKPSGFVIVPADDLVEPIICFAPAGRYIASDKNPLGALVMRDVPARVALARATAPEAPAEHMVDAHAKWKNLRNAGKAAEAAASVLTGVNTVSDMRVSPLTHTMWDQNTVNEAAGPAIYNYYTPPGPNGNMNNYPSGCVATMLAQLMRYYQYPTAGVGTGSFTIYVDGTSKQAHLIGGNGAGGPYVWANMILVPTNSITLAQQQAIGALCYDAGVAVHMQYTAFSSGAYMADAATALQTTFMYSNALDGTKDFLSNIGPGLIAMINPNLDAGFPVLFGISGSPGGHAIIGDGYGYDSNTLYHHVNMGWSGVDNAWYNLPTIQSPIGTFNVLSECVYNIYVTGSGEIISGRVLNTAGIPIAGATVTATGKGGPFTATTNSKGIYFFAKIPSNSTYTLTASATGYKFSNLTATTGHSSNYAAASGNVWGKDFGSGNTYVLSVQSTPVAGLAIGSTTGQGGTTNYQISLKLGASVILTAPVSDPPGYQFLQWTINGATQPVGQKPVVFTISGPMTAVAVYQVARYSLNVQSTPATGVVISSTSGLGGATNYSKTPVKPGTVVTLTAPASISSIGKAYTFQNWTVNGVSQPAGQVSLNLKMPSGNLTAVAVYHPKLLAAEAVPEDQAAPSAAAPSAGTTAAPGQPGNGPAWSFGAPALVSSCDGIVDDRDHSDAKQFTVLSGAWSSAVLDSAYAGGCTFTDATAGAQTGRVRFSCTALNAGRYDVYAWWPARSDGAAQVAYEVHHAAGGTTVRVNQSAGGGQWNLLGTFNFAAGSHVVDVHNGASAPGVVVCADAVRFVPAGTDITR